MQEERNVYYSITGITGVISGILCGRTDATLAWSGGKEDDSRQN